MITLSKEKVLQLHERLSSLTGGDKNLRDEGLLDSALLSAFQTFGGEELYPTVEEKAARIGYSLICNHAFVDGNKRIGILVMLTFLEVNGVCLEASNDEVAALGYGIASGEIPYERLLDWLRLRITK